jgi:tape measure domain-containing protein
MGESDVVVRLTAQGVAQTSAGVKQVEKALGGIGAAAGKSAGDAVHGLGRVGGAVGHLRSVIGSLAGLTFAGLGLRELADMADTVTNLRARLELATGSTATALARFGQMRDIANRMQQPLKDVADVYLGISRAAGDLGATQSQLIKFSEGVAASLRLSGTSGAAASGALLQLSQMMGGANVQAQEFNSLVDGAPVLLRTVAANIGATGISMDELRKRVLAGKLSTKEFFEAFLKGAGDLKRQAESMPPTIGGAFTVLKNNVTDLVGRMDDQFKVTHRVAAAVLGLANNLDHAIAAVKIAALVVATYYNRTVLVPAVIGLWTTAKTALTAALVRFQLASAISGSTVGTLVTALKAANASTLTLTGSVSKLGVAFGVLGAAVLGWSIGTILREEFLEAQLFGIAFVNSMLKGWEALKYSARVAWAYIKDAWRGAIEVMGGVFGVFLSALAGGLQALGLDSAAKKLQGWAKDALKATSNAGVLEAELADLKDGYTKASGEIDRITGEMADEAIAAKAAGNAHATVGAEVVKVTTKKRELSAEQKGVIKSLRDETEKLLEQYVELTAGRQAMERYKAAKVGVSAEASRAIALNGELRDTIEALKLETKLAAEAEEEIHKARIKAGEAASKYADGIEAQVAKLREENEVLRYTKADLAALSAERLDAQIEIARQAVAQDELSLICNEETEAHRRTLAALLDLKSARGDAVYLQAAKDARDEWSKTAESIGQGLTDSLFRAFETGKGFFSTFWAGIKNLFKTTVLKMMIQPVQGAITGVVGAALGTGGAQAGQGGVGGVVGMGASLTSAYNSAAGMVSTGWEAVGSAASYAGTYGGATYGTAFGSQQSAMLAAQESGMGFGAGSEALGGSAFGSAAGMAAGVAAGIYGGRAISGGYATGGSGNANVNAGTAIGTAIGAYFGMPAVGAAVGGWVGGVVNRAFGRQSPNVSSQGITGTLGAGGLTGTQFRDWTQKGGWFKSDRAWTDHSVVDAQFADALKASTAGVLAETQRWAKAIGIPGDKLKDVTTSVRVALTGKAEDDTKAIAAALTQYQGALANSLGGALRSFRHTGETLAKTLERLNAMQVFADTLNNMGGIFSRVATLSITAQEELYAFAGGIEAFAAKAKGFVEAYYSDNERMAIQARQLQGQLTAIGVDPATLATRGDYRKLVEGQDISTTLGRARLADLLDLSQVFAGLGQYLEQQGGTLATLAAQAPQNEIVARLLEGSAQQQTDTADGLSAIDDSVMTIGDRITASVEALHASVALGLAAVAAATQASLRQLQAWDNNGQLSTTTEQP